jgi:hypothetical protein
MNLAALNNLNDSFNMHAEHAYSEVIRFFENFLTFSARFEN